MILNNLLHINLLDISPTQHNAFKLLNYLTIILFKIPPLLNTSRILYLILAFSNNSWQFPWTALCKLVEAFQLIFGFLDANANA